MGKKDCELGQEIRTWSTFVPEETGDAVKNILKSKWINTGKQEKLFRQKVSEKFDFQYCVAVNNGTAALRASLAALGVSPGDEVVSTPYTFIATNTSILEQGATPVFADIQYDTLNIDPKSIVEKITDKTKAIMCVHYGGNPCDMDEIRKIGQGFNLPIIEDSAHALGSKYKGHYIGSTGDIITFSFQVVKIVTCGDGGIIATTNEEYYKKLKKYSWYGVDREERKNNLIDPLPESIDVLGFKYNMNDITATIGIVGIEHFDIPFKRRIEIGERYQRELADCKKIRILHYPSENTPNYQIFPIHVEKRLDFAKYMIKHGIMVNVNNRRNDRYSIFGGLNDLPVTEKVDNDTILIPLHADLTDSNVDKIIDTIHKYDCQ
ncbi:MAG: DegT/DnrJ/EryC1/StrS family aminotransferase [Candidatus Cloacimonetes bacterium]|nr:DegT/DnrJ/EryC1/StrS family aminotransferase [Candidatus Cloacimonadota bacterium]